MKTWKKVVYGLCMLGSIGVLSGCEKEVNIGGKTTLIVGTIGNMSEVQKQVDWFNTTQDKIQLEVKVYERDSVSGMNAEDVAKMEIAAGKGTDILVYGNWYAQSNVSCGIMQDLDIYMNQDETFVKDNYFTNILEAYKIIDKQYVVPVSFRISTYAGKEKLIGEKENWTVEELSECYSGLGENAVLFPGDLKTVVFAFLGTGSVDNYINWGTGECSFDGDSFIQLLEFSNRFPDTFVYDEDLSLQKEFREDRALLYPVTVSDVYRTALVNCLFEGEPVNYIGYPGVGGNGSIVENGSLVMGITTNCKEPDMAWQFIKTFLEEDYQDKIREYLPVHRGSLEKWLKAAQEKEYKENGEEKIKAEALFDGEESLWITAITEADAKQILDLIENAATLSAIDDELRNIIFEEASTYFAGDRKAETTAEIIQSRVKVYVGERVY
ncbi:MAG: extracellular solute-binding protein [Lachnospiraceae bacterium]|nr:extracellular solute-binding protein [Lachnospiraceae bacterium]